jgi:hypothetical protein
MQIKEKGAATDQFRKISGLWMTTFAIFFIMFFIYDLRIFSSQLMQAKCFFSCRPVPSIAGHAHQRLVRPVSMSRQQRGRLTWCFQSSSLKT